MYLPAGCAVRLQAPGQHGRGGSGPGRGACRCPLPAAGRACGLQAAARHVALIKKGAAQKAGVKNVPPGPAARRAQPLRAAARRAADVDPGRGRGADGLWRRAHARRRGGWRPRRGRRRPANNYKPCWSGSRAGADAHAAARPGQGPPRRRGIQRFINSNPRKLHSCFL